MWLSTSKRETQMVCNLICFPTGTISKYIYNLEYMAYSGQKPMPDNWLDEKLTLLYTMRKESHALTHSVTEAVYIWHPVSYV
jgi:hypothetical protein